MHHFNDATLQTLLTPADAEAALVDAFRAFGEGRAAVQERVRTSAGEVKLSTLGAVLPEQGFAGAKVYTTIGGAFSFVVLLFSSRDGRPLASFDAGAITQLRTAACSVIAARHLARPEARRLAIFGVGVQGQAHARQLAAAFPLEEIRLVDPRAPTDLAAQLAAECGVPVALTTVERALDGADIVVTASRSLEPLFPGDALPPGSFVAAIGSSLPHARELDDRALERAATICVEWRTQALHEAGDLVRAAPSLPLDDKLVDLADLVRGTRAGRTDTAEITIYKAVGIGLQDVALAGLAYRRMFPGEAE